MSNPLRTWQKGLRTFQNYSYIATTRPSGRERSAGSRGIVTADQWSAVSLPQANGQREAPESAPGHSQGIVPALRGILNISWLSWVTGLVLTIWGARKQSVKRHKMTTWVSWVYAHQIMRIRIRQKRFEILKVHIKLFRLRQQFSFVRRPERGRLGV